MHLALKKREINPEAKRAAILSAAYELFAGQGYEATSIAAIAAKADVAVGTVHRIFTDKAHLLQAAKTEIETRLTDIMIKAWAIQAPLEKRFQTMLSALFDEMILVQRFMPVMALKAETSRQPTDGQIVRNAIRIFMRDEMAARTFRKMPIDEATEIVFGMVDSAMRHAAAGDIHEARLIYVPLLAGMMTRAVAADA
jgi:AcrR family transcriptional regulator